MQRKVHVAGILYACIFGFTFMFSKVAMNYVSPIGLIAYRFLIAFLAFEILRLTKMVKISFRNRPMKELFLVALFQPILYFLTETYGLHMTTSGEAGLMIAMIPIFVTLLSSLILKEKPRAIQLLFILLSVSGVFFIQIFKVQDGIQLEIVGYLLLLAAVISAALFNIASRHASKLLKPYEITYFMMFYGAIVFNIIYLIQLMVEGRIADYVQNLYHIELIFPILYLGIVASIGGFFLVNFALSQAPAHVTSIYANLSTIVAVAAGVLLLQEKLEYYHFIGSAMIIIGVYGTVRFKNYHKEIKQTLMKGDFK